VGAGALQQINATTLYANAEDWLNARLHFPHYPDPIVYIGIIGLLALGIAAAAGAMSKVFGRPDLTFSRGGTFQDRASRFRAYFLPITYGLIPVVGADYFARQLPKFFQYSPRVIPSVQRMLGSTSAIHSSLFNLRILSDPRIVVAQVVVMALGTAGGLWATWRISGRELVAVSRGKVGVRAASVGLVVLCGLAAAVLYVLINAAD
jgi:hypothetical protein